MNPTQSFMYLFQSLTFETKPFTNLQLQHFLQIISYYLYVAECISVVCFTFKMCLVEISAQSHLFQLSVFVFTSVVLDKFQNNALK
jgi:hypothetical protein